MTNEMKNVPGLRFPEFDGYWEEKKLKDISNKGMYGIGASATEFDGENVYVRITDINESSRKINNDKLTSPDKLDKKYLLNENDVLFARTGASTGKTYIHKHYDRDKNYYFAGFLIKFEFKNNYLANFIFQNTLTKRFENWVSVMSVRSGQPGINSEEYGKLKMMFPSKVEQNKIGAFFSKLDRQIELEEQKLEKLEEQKKGYMQKIFSQELRFKDKNGNDYPEWKKEIIGNIATTFSGGTPSSTNSTFYTGEIPFIRSGEISKNSTELMINEKAISNSSAKMVETGDLLYALYGATSGEVAISKINGAINQAVLCIRSQESIGYIFNYLKMKKDQILKTYIQGGQGNLSASIIKKVDIDLPSLEEQKLIGHFFNKFDDYIEIQSDKVKLLKERKKGFLQKMFV
ncbi:restriction endonuclease subunit S [Staphylococcus saprophyticus]|nr:restriction endonuclease subunit S [Staphylococcus saprophyticus]